MLALLRPQLVLRRVLRPHVLAVQQPLGSATARSQNAACRRCLWWPVTNAATAAHMPSVSQSNSSLLVSTRAVHVGPLWLIVDGHALIEHVFLHVTSAREGRIPVHELRTPALYPYIFIVRSSDYHRGKWFSSCSRSFLINLLFRWTHFRRSYYNVHRMFSRLNSRVYAQRN